MIYVLIKINGKELEISKCLGNIYIIINDILFYIGTNNKVHIKYNDNYSINFIRKNNIEIFCLTKKDSSITDIFNTLVNILNFIEENNITADNLLSKSDVIRKFVNGRIYNNIISNKDEIELADKSILIVNLLTKNNPTLYVTEVDIDGNNYIINKNKKINKKNIMIIVIILIIILLIIFFN